ncbi:MAG: tRNA uridine-5-carboxymethylaminomethyl(34) synthesis GTPase MnmE [Deltaproteobacteria bacterium]|nr:tRNA uridine-5-carboxymethylaminomethyl(34) synthesis GTPase MnmE [Deltaproteobacteria bacterium]MBU50106.1 tRNA uridine-5-carboxymethylaminomethyl(34) synthesis GTPase MnmE [Deltaproteobacteria bacterium]|tara:strand:+ start:17030 stop:18454 length:1425 start_codon:yes stop_codon:yes gene_type:complete
MSTYQLRQDKDTIAAIATASGEGGVGIIRISGAQSRPIIEQMFTPHHATKEWRSHKLYFGECHDQTGDVLDEVLVTWMAKGHSYTGEDVVEIHAHGGTLNLLQLLRESFRLGARPAEAGEFTKRAFLHGRIDLTRAEAIADMISANNEQALRIARSHLRGDLKGRIDKLAEHSLLLAAQVESWIDFPEEFDPALDDSVARLLDDIKAFTTQVHTLLKSYETGRKIQQGWSLVLLGKPNAGKSSLFNYINGEERAIVTSLPGTTRDLLETQIALGGLHVSLADSAGLRTLAATQHDAQISHDAIEQIGINRALKAAEGANLLLAVLDRSRPWGEEDQKVLDACQGRDTILVLNKCDLPDALKLSQAQKDAFAPLHIAEISCESKDGCEPLVQWLEQYMTEQTSATSIMITNERQRDALKEAHKYLQKALDEGLSLGPEFVAEDLRAARQSLVQITGQVSSEDILEAIFTRFCIGK